MSKNSEQPDIPVFSIHNLPDKDYDFAVGAAFLINKPYGWTSFRVVGLLRKLTGIKKIGHAGTLDPMATGLLILCAGKATKQISKFQDQVKSYKATITLGGRTPSYDKETEIIETSDFSHVTHQLTLETIQSHFLGEIEQIPPMYSAIKIGGKTLYKLARKGVEIERQPRKVQIFRCDVISFNKPEITIQVTCSKGTYIRSIANDLGVKLGTLANLSELERTSIGDYTSENALDVSTLISEFDPDEKLGISV